MVKYLYKIKEGEFMKKNFIIDGIILIFLALILFFTALSSSEYFICNIILGVLVGFMGILIVFSGVTGKAPFTGKELKMGPIKPKKRYNVKKTFIVTGIIQGVFAIIYLMPWVYVAYSPQITRDVLDAFGFLFVLSVIFPVMPVCFICNIVALISARDENGKGEKEGIKWLYIILSALAISIAWLFGLGPIAARF
jgi:hypothetical protein